MPPLKRDPKRKNIVQIYLNDEEKELMTSAADGLGLPLVSWIRMLAILKAKEIKAAEIPLAS